LAYEQLTTPAYFGPGGVAAATAEAAATQAAAEAGLTPEELAMYNKEMTPAQIVQEQYGPMPKTVASPAPAASAWLLLGGLALAWWVWK